MSALTEFLFPAPAPRSARAILAWWERRRLGYNVWVGAAGTVSLAAFALASVALSGRVQVEASLIGAAIFGFMANVCYLLGPTTEILVDKLWGREVLPVGPALFRMGLTFSVGLALLPTLLVAIALVVRTVLGILS